MPSNSKPAAVTDTQAATVQSFWIRKRDELIQALAMKSSESMDYGMRRTALHVVLKPVAETDLQWDFRQRKSQRYPASS
jgi:hypothetical protein